jgi:HAD superfamily hydrolase (TIGR01509 family)
MMLNSSGVIGNVEAAGMTIGSDLRTQIGILFREANADPTVERVREATALLLSHTARRFANGIAWRPGAHDLLHATRACYATALVTNTGRSLVEAAFPANGRYLFDAMVCGDDVANSKPAPDPYLRAAALLDLEPAACLAVEDTPTGVAAAESAGVPVLAVAYELPIAHGRRRIVRPMLEGLSVDDLRHTHREICRRS